MTTLTAAHNKTLFVGNARICQQIAYVLAVQDYALAEKLTAQNWEQYRDYQIYVCEFQRQSRKFVRLRKQLSEQLNLQYLDDICRLLDGVTAEPTNQALAVPTAPVAAQNTKVTPTRDPLMQRIARGMKHPFRATWHVFLRLKHQVHRINQRCRAAAKRKRQLAQMQQKRRLAERQKRQNQREQQKQIRQHNIKFLQGYLPNLKPSALLLYVLRAKPNPKIRCTRLETNLRVGEKGDLRGCCGAMVAFGNLLHTGELDEIYHSTYARIVKLSSLNRSYCLCNVYGSCKGYRSNGQPLPTEQWQTGQIPKNLLLDFDCACNLCCKSCRTKPHVISGVEQEHVNVITTKLLRSGWLDQVKTLKLAGMGEVFYSPAYRQLLTTDLQRQQILIFSNGTLLNENNWRLVADKYATIDVSISVDAATAETYRQLRGGDFVNLVQNLTMLSDLHRRKQIRKFGLNFVVQRDNFREMPAFVRLGQTLGVDYVNFQRLNNFGTFTAQELLERCLIIDNKYLDYDLWWVLQDPIFRDPMVNLGELQRYIDASEHLYRRRYEKEQRQRRSV